MTRRKEKEVGTMFKESKLAFYFKSNDEVYHPQPNNESKAHYEGNMSSSASILRPNRVANSINRVLKLVFKRKICELNHSPTSVASQPRPT